MRCRFEAAFFLTTLIRKLVMNQFYLDSLCGSWCDGLTLRSAATFSADELTKRSVGVGDQYLTILVLIDNQLTGTEGRASRGVTSCVDHPRSS